MEVTTRIADYANPEDARTVSDLLNGYALDAFGNSAPLEPDVRATLCAHLGKVSGAFSVVASVGGGARGAHQRLPGVQHVQV